MREKKYIEIKNENFLNNQKNNGFAQLMNTYQNIYS